MSVVAKTLIPARYAVSAFETQYTANGVRTIVDKFTATNNSGSVVEFSLFLVPNGGTAGDAQHRLLNRRSIDPGICYTCPEIVGHVMEPGDKIVTLASVGGSITIRASGREVT